MAFDVKRCSMCIVFYKLFTGVVTVGNCSWSVYLGTILKIPMDCMSTSCSQDTENNENEKQPGGTGFGDKFGKV